MAVFVWEGYIIYAAVIFVLSGGSITMTIFETKKNNEQIRNMARYECKIEVMREDENGVNSHLIEVNSSELVPGDLVKVPEGLVLPCDLVLISGGAIVNESILTGESIPVMK